MGAELCLAHDIGGWRHWGPLLVDMQPYGCFILHRVGAPKLKRYPKHLGMFQSMTTETIFIPHNKCFGLIYKCFTSK